MVEPEIYEFLAWMTDVADTFGLAVLPEVHDSYATHERLSAHGFWTYDFVLPGPACSMRSRRARPAGWPTTSRLTEPAVHDPRLPRRHPRATGPRRRPRRRRRCATSPIAVRARGGNVNRILSDDARRGGDVHQLNCTYYSALDCDDDRYLAARAIQLFARGVPQIYYVGLLAGENDHEAVDRTGEGRAINRHDYSIDRDRRAPSTGRSSGGSSSWSGCATPTRRSTARSRSKPTTITRFGFVGGTARTSPRWTSTSPAAARCSRMGIVPSRWQGGRRRCDPTRSDLPGSVADPSVHRRQPEYQERQGPLIFDRGERAHPPGMTWH